MHLRVLVLTGGHAASADSADIARAVARLIEPHQQPADWNIDDETADDWQFTDYAIGGRFAGSLRGGTVQPLDDPATSASTVGVGDLAALVTPDGIWHESLRPRGPVDENNLWVSTVRDAFIAQQTSARPGYAVIVDCRT
jgi:hypothetical protein